MDLDGLRGSCEIAGVFIEVQKTLTMTCHEGFRDGIAPIIVSGRIGIGQNVAVEQPLNVLGKRLISIRKPLEVVERRFVRRVVRSRRGRRRGRDGLSRSLGLSWRGRRLRAIARPREGLRDRLRGRHRRVIGGHATGQQILQRWRA